VGAEVLRVEPRTVEGTVVLAVSGEVDIANRRVMHAALEDALDGAQRAVVVDLSDVRFMDSTGLALMLNAARRLTRRQLGFAVACPPDGPVRRAFGVAGLEDCFKIAGGVDDALAGAQPAFSG
jgi:anti-anti-sigma factor